MVTAIEEEFGRAPAEMINEKEEEKKILPWPMERKGGGGASAVVEQPQKKTKVGGDHLVFLDKLGDAGSLMEVP